MWVIHFNSYDLFALITTLINCWILYINAEHNYSQRAFKYLFKYNVYFA